MNDKNGRLCRADVSSDKKMMIIISSKLALQQARIVPGIKVDDDGNVTAGESKAHLQALVDAYREIIGGLAVTFAKKAIKPLLTGREDLPEELK